MKIPHIHCPVNGWDCPYYTNSDHPCRCLLDHPHSNCDDFYAAWGDEATEEDYVDDDWEEE